MPLAPSPNAQLEATTTLRDRSPHPYFRQGSTVESDQFVNDHIKRFSTLDGDQTSEDDSAQETGSRAIASSSGGSESGTEADDERPSVLKSLPPPAFRPRKGLKTGDGPASPLLTPSQLDIEGRRLSQGYFNHEKAGGRTTKAPDLKELGIERQKFEQKRRAERIRRLAEGGLVGLIGLIIGNRPLLSSPDRAWHVIAILSQALAVSSLVASYPLRLVSVEQGKRHIRIESRFRVPPSFDPATVLYPACLPALVALCLLPQDQTLLLPNLILGLAALPARLFPDSTRVMDINAMHWTVSLTPLVVRKLVEWPLLRIVPRLAKVIPLQPPQSLPEETMALLYPLHQALLSPIHYLTTTSLLPAEKQLLSAALINLYLFSASPQGQILRSLIWVGGILLFITCQHVLRWNVALARIPQWRFRAASGRRVRWSLLADLKHGLSSLFMSRPRSGAAEAVCDSDADEGHTVASRRRRSSLKLGLALNRSITQGYEAGPVSAVEPGANGHAKPWDDQSRTLEPVRRRNTISTVDAHGPLLLPEVLVRARGSKSRRQDWFLGLNPITAGFRKYGYAVYIYTCILVIILWSVRLQVSEQALEGAEPILWAIDYLFGDLSSLYTNLETKGWNWELVQDSIAKSLEVITASSSIPALRETLGSSNTRLVLIAYCLVVLSVGIIAVLLLTSHIEVDTRRKIFHGIMVTMLLPATFVDPCFCALALSLVLAIFLLLEVIRAGAVAPLSSAIGRFVAPYVDGRDLRGPVVVSHVFLLIGCAVPLWLSLASFGRVEHGWEIEGQKREVGMIAGVVCVGMGDAAASLIGRRYGRHKWPWIGGKSLEGSAAFAGAVTVGLMAAKAWLWIGGWQDARTADAESMRGVAHWVLDLGKTIIAACGASFMEAVLTGANDNVVVPIALWLLVRGLDL